MGSFSDCAIGGGDRRYVVVQLLCATNLVLMFACGVSWQVWAVFAKPGNCMHVALLAEPVTTRHCGQNTTIKTY